MTSFSVDRPELLYLLWMLPLAAVLLIWGLRRRRKILARWAAPEARALLAAEAAWGLRGVKALLLLLALAALLVGLAGLRWGHTWKNIERRGMDLMVVMDVSRSMLAEDQPPSRLARAKREVVDLLDRLSGEKAGIVAFAGTAFVQCPLTLDQAAFRLFLDALGPDYAPVGGTNLALALDTARKALDQPDGAEKAILLLTDGEPTTREGREAALQAAKAVKDAGMRLYCMGLGTPEGAPVPAADGKGGFTRDESGAIVISRLTEDTLRQMAEQGGGVYVRATPGDEDLETIYDGHIRANAATLTDQEGRRRVLMDRFRLFAGLALGLLLLELLLPDRRRASGPLDPRRASGLLVLTLCLFLAGSAQAGLRSDLQAGQQAFEAEQYEEALNHWLAAQVEAPERADLLYNLGNAFYRLNRFEEAEKHYQAAAESWDKEGKSAERAQALYNEGNARFRQQKLQEAVESYEQSLKLNPEDADAQANVEFIKKLMEQQPPQSCPNGQQQDQDKDQQNKDKQQNQQQQNQDKNQQQNDSQQQGDDQQSKKPEDQSMQDGSDQQQEQSEDKQQDQQKQQDEQQQGASGQQEQQDKQEQQRRDGSTFADRMQTPEEQPEQPEQQGAMSAAQQAPEEEGEKRPGPEEAAAAAMLNRLRDQPGKAMPPAYAPNDMIERNW